MVVDSIEDLFEDDKIRGHSLVLSVHKPRSSSISLSESKKEYHIQIQRDSDKIDENDPVL